jgi:hypothetical protein
VRSRTTVLTPAWPPPAMIASSAAIRAAAGGGNVPGHGGDVVGIDQRDACAAGGGHQHAVLADASQRP